MNFKKIYMWSLITIVTSCSASSGDDIRFQLSKELMVSSISTHSVDLAIGVEIDSKTVSVDRLQDVNVEVRLGNFTANAEPIKELDFTKQKKVELDLKFSTSTRELPEKTFHALWQSRLKYEAELDAKLAHVFPVSRTIKRVTYDRDRFLLHLTGRPDHALLHLVGISKFALNPKGVKSTIKLHFTNPFKFKITVKEINLDLKLGKLKLGKAKVLDPVEVEPSADHQFLVQHNYKWSNAVMTALHLLSILEGPIVIDLKGEVTIATVSGDSEISLKGQYKIKATDLLNPKIIEDISITNDTEVTPPVPEENPKPILIKPKLGVDYEVSSEESRLQDLSPCEAPTLIAHIPQNFAAEFEAELGREYSMDPKEEMQLGSKILPSVIKQMKGSLDQSSVQARYVQTIGRLIAKHSRSKGINYQFSILKGVKEENAFALPGGYIIITEPMLSQRVQNEAQLAGILGHEIAHVELRHSTAIAGAIKKVMGPGKEAQLIAMIASSIISSPYNSAKESAADLWGLRASYLTGYSALTLSDFWNQGTKPLPQKKKKKSKGDLMEVGFQILTEGTKILEKEIEAVTSSHPKSAYRACLARKNAAVFAIEFPRTHSVLGKSSYQSKKPTLP
jgi:Zn-dependent protease with chaperone function/LEA14-like dessication related protein